MSDEPLLKIDEAARLLNVSRRTIYRIILEGSLPYLRVRSDYRFEPAALRAYIEQARGNTS